MHVCCVLCFVCARRGEAAKMAGVHDGMTMAMNAAVLQLHTWYTHAEPRSRKEVQRRMVQNSSVVQSPASVPGRRQCPHGLQNISNKQAKLDQQPVQRQWKARNVYLNAGVRWSYQGTKEMQRLRRVRALPLGKYR
jgi:hypothetical protein